MKLNQPLVERHQVDINIPQSSSQARNINETETSENLTHSYWEIIRSQMGHKKFSSIILGLENCMIVILRL
jgi:capsular polysaccharide biosynthesis protein